MNKISTLSLLAFLLLAMGCNKTYPMKVTYQATGAVSAYNLQYLDDQNVLVKTTILPQSEQDVWNYDFEAEQGDIVYMNGKYNDVNSGLKLQLLIDGKMYKQASTEGDTIKYVVVSGTVPYE
ncbi:MAG: hypothetical protein DRJ02_08100 [Bacteroidetes bacterium]|nr:MAG: hypothetical protein DRJ02_08100 [Bacteroidota bacterium]